MGHKSISRDLPWIIIIISGGLTLAIGLTGFLGWYVENQSFLHLFPVHTSIHNNAAFGFILSGMGLLFTALNKKMPGILTGVIIMFASIYAVFVWIGFFSPGWIFKITDVTLPLDNVVYTDALFRYIAISFLLSGIAILCANLTVKLFFRTLLMGVIGILIAGKALVASFSYVSGIHFPVFGEEGMEFEIMAGFSLIGVGVIAQAFRIEKSDRRTLYRWLPAVVLTGVAFLTFALWQAMLEGSRETVDRTTNISARIIEREILNKTHDRVGALERMARRWEIWARPEQASWESDAELYVKHYPGIMFLEWIDSDFHIQWCVKSGNIHHEYSHPSPDSVHLNALHNAFILHESVISSTEKLIDGLSGFYICIPIFINDKFDGFISAFISSDIFFERAIHDSYLKSFSILIDDGENNIFEQINSESDDSEEWTKMSRISHYAIQWNIRIRPEKQLLGDLITPLPKLVLSIGLFLALLLAFTTYLAQTARKRSRDLVESQKNLTFLVDASGKMNTTFNYHITLENLAKMTIPDMADICTVFIKENDEIRLVTVAHQDPEIQKQSKKLQTVYDISQKDNHGIQNVIINGKPELYKEITKDLIPKITLGGKHQQFIMEINPKSAMIVPLISGDRVLGVITFGLTDENRRYTENDLRLAQDLALRAAQAVDNAKLYGEAKGLNEELEARVKQRTAELELANNELESFSYSVSHDLREPLRHVSGFVDLLEKHAGKTLDEKGNRYIRTIADSAIKMGMLIDDLLSFSRMSRSEVKKSIFKVDELVNEVVSELKTDTNRRKIVWKIDSLPEIYADRSMIKIVFSNILSNAVKYTRPRKEAIIEIRFINGEFIIKDNGVGFDMKYYNKLFGVFQRFHTDSEFEGTGIGLANVRRIIQRHRGEIYAESEPDKGTTFYFSLVKREG